MAALPRKNIFISKELDDRLRYHAYKEHVSEAEVGRRALDLYLSLAEDDGVFDKAIAFAEKKEVSLAEVIAAALRKVL